ncbi:unnamed protein product, partial [Effrenium voratum]
DSDSDGPAPAKAPAPQPAAPAPQPAPQPEPPREQAVAAVAVLRQRAEAREARARPKGAPVAPRSAWRSAAGALNLLEPDSSDSAEAPIQVQQGTKRPAEPLERPPRRQLEVQPEVQPELQPEVQPEVPPELQPEVQLEVQMQPEPPEQPAELQDRPKDLPDRKPQQPEAPSEPAPAPERPAQEPAPPEEPVLPPRGGLRSLTSFLGPDEGLAAKWSEGALQLPGAELPEPIASCLRGYQRKGVAWLYQRLYVENRGCLLTDEMGLGKTVQVACCLAAALFARQADGLPAGPVLVLCPPTLVRNWARELSRWGPFSVEVLTPQNASAPAGRQRVLQRVEAGLTDVVVASRGLLIRHESVGPGSAATDALLALRWGCVVVDEVHQAKNPKGQLHKAIVALHSDRKLGLTGTPLQNSLSDVWTLLRTVDAHEGWDLGTFESRFSRPILKGQKRKASAKDLAVREDALKEFQELLARNCLRRTKDDVALMLPGKNDRVVPCPLSPVQRAAYQNLLESPDFQIALGKRELCVCGAGRPCFCGSGPVWRYLHRRQAESKGLEDEWAAADECSCRGRKSPKCMALSLIVMLQRLCNHLEQLKPDPQPPKDDAEAQQQ